MNREIRCHRLGATVCVVGRVQVRGTYAVGVWDGPDGGAYCALIATEHDDEEAGERVDRVLSAAREVVTTQTDHADLVALACGLAEAHTLVLFAEIDVAAGTARWGSATVADGGASRTACGTGDLSNGLFLGLEGPNPVSRSLADDCESVLDAVTAAVGCAQSPLFTLGLGCDAPSGPSVSVKSRIAANIGGIELSARCFASLAASLDIPDRVRRAMLIALDDLLGNVISHAYEDAENEYFEVHVFAAPVGIRIAVRDTGPAFNPFALAEPDTTLDLEDRMIGGLGVHLVRKLMDEVSYERDGDANVVWLFKGLTES